VFIIRALDVPTPGREPAPVEEFGEVAPAPVGA